MRSLVLLLASCASGSTPPASSSPSEVTIAPVASASSARTSPDPKSAASAASATSVGPASPVVPSKPIPDETDVPECNAYIAALRACEPSLHAEIQAGNRPVAASEIYALKMAIDQLAMGTPGLSPKVSVRMLEQIAASCEASRQQLPASCRP